MEWWTKYEEGVLRHPVLHKQVDSEIYRRQWQDDPETNLGKRYEAEKGGAEISTSPGQVK